MKNAEYWRGRFSLIEDAAQHEADRCISSLEDIYRDAERTVQADLERWYGRFAVNNQISLTEARKMLTTGQLEEFKWTVDQYIKAAQAGNMDPVWIKKLENASAKFHVTRLESIQLQIQQQLELLYGNQLDSVDDLLKKVISQGYTRSAFEIQKGIGLGWDITALDQKHLETLLSKPWTADKKTFRDRCWENQANLVSGIQTRLTQSLLRGDKLTRTRDEISRQFHVSKYKAGRLVHTETTYFNAVAAKETYGELGVDKIEIIETLDSHTCELCQPLDGTIIPMTQYEPGVTVPPFHPNCRGTTAPAIDSAIIGERAARDGDGTPTYYVPSNMTYEQWQDAFVNGGSKKGLTSAKGQDILDYKDIALKKLEKVESIKQHLADLSATNKRWYLSRTDFTDPEELAKWRAWKKSVDISEVFNEMVHIQQHELPEARLELAEARIQLLRHLDSSGFTPASTIKDADAYCQSVLGINADYKGLSIEAANEWNRGLTNMQDVFPEMIQKNFRFVGESHQRNAIAKEIEYKRQLDFIRNNNIYGWSDEKCEKYARDKANSFVRRYLSVGNQMASSWSPGPPFDICRGICLNSGFYKKYDAAVESMIHQVEIKWHPVSCSTVKSVFDHEFGHQLDDWLHIRDQANIKKLYNDLSRKDIVDNLSEYGCTNIQEMIAEAWSEYCNNPNPRPIAQEVGETVERLYKQWAEWNL